MRRTLTTLVALIFSITFFVLSPNPLYGFNVTLVKKIGFEENSKLQFTPISFCVTEDGFFLIPDHEKGNVKIYEMNGEALQLVKTFGPKGFGDDEYNMPAYCFYDKNRSKLGIIDIGIGTKKVYIYDRRGRVDFVPASIIDADGFDMRFAGDGKHLVISGYTTDSAGRSFELFSINLENPGQPNYLLSSYEKYGLSSDEEYQREYKDQTLPAIGIRAFIDIQGDDVYFVWEGKARIIKINLKTKTSDIFDETKKQRMPNYFEPTKSVELEVLRKSYVDMDISKIKKQRTKMSLVRNIFATPLYVFVVYEGPNESNFRLQMYSPEGEFLGDSAIPGNCSWIMWFDKESDTLYSLQEKSEKKKQDIHMLVYNVKE